LVIFEAHFFPQGPFPRAIFGTISFSRAIPATMSWARYYKSNNFIFETRCQRTLVSKTEEPAHAQAAIMPATIGRNARLRAYSTDTSAMLRTLVGRPAEGV
jgi:hypothetical protein